VKVCAEELSYEVAIILLAGPAVSNETGSTYISSSGEIKMSLRLMTWVKLVPMASNYGLTHSHFRASGASVA
jgi:hypothetical protein